MSKERNALKAGSFILGSVVVIVGLVVAIKGTAALQAVDKRIVEFTLEDNVGGLRVGDDVRIGGARVGDVHEIEIINAPADISADAPATQPASGGGAKIRVTFGIPRTYPIRAGARIGVESSVTGQSWLNFTDLGRGETLALSTPLQGAPSPLTAALARVPEILAAVQNETLPRVNRTIDGAGTLLADARTQTLPRVNNTVDSYKATADAGTELVKKVQGHVDPAAEKFHKVADNTAGMTAEIRDVFGDTKVDIRSTMSNVSSATGSLKTSLPGILEKVDTAVAKINTTIEGATAAMEDIKKVAENTRDLTASAKAVIAGNKGKLDGMIASLKATSDNMKNATAELRRSPWRLLYRPSNKETANLNIYDAARQFAEGANDLNDATQALRDALNSKSADPEQLKKLVAAMEESFQKFNDVEKKLWSEVKE